VNIAGMQVSRDERGGQALMALTVDSALGQALLAAIVETIGAGSGRAVDLAD
jgi:D-3-phosphoglycerate dehydrogenase / 2-oxoglutarate reductase